MNNRVIKFRAWDKERKEWLKKSDIYDMLKDQALWNPEMSEYYKIQQFTGLFDKNDKEIFEGDIIKFEYNPRNILICKVEYSNYNASFDIYHYYTPNNKESMPIGLTKERAEIIGNIFENSDLLK